MKQILLSILLLTFNLLAFSQDEKASNKSVAIQFESNYNNESYEAIFLSFSPEMQKALPLDKAITFLSGLKKDAGKINRRQFLRYNQSYAMYKTEFERALFALSISLDDHAKINGFFIKPLDEKDLPKKERNTTHLILPFKGEWAVVWGGDTEALNYHVTSETQKGAFDMLIKNSKGNSYKTNGKTNADFYAFGQELIAPCDGEVVLVIDGIEDNEPGKMNPAQATGNTVIIKSLNDEYLVFAHFKRNSVIVKKGSKIKKGQLLGLCGNSGNSSEPHLHLHMQNTQYPNSGTGIKCFFDKIVVDGEIKSDYSPIKNQKIRNEKM
ncbi:peptidoglycan DD-metalloendopeptidase family protein [Pedobacter aquatilis]|uniref:peptidoglycan DD-metalloendopeptidase family protein n=1 Tax=Pedobacter aquatilis TaxID=351343 RepID=UPI0029312A04|nr:peptidoglycan DD-metalloendopeptidase family protein [Pedobacter aquatilis]